MMIPATRTSPLLIACILCVLNGCSTRPQAPDVASTPAAHVDRARVAYAQGRFEEAAADLERAADSHDGQDPLAQADILLDLGSARTMIGHHDAAADALIVSYVLARDAGDTTRQARALNALGVVYTFNPAAGQSPTTRPATHPVTTQTSHCDPSKPDARADIEADHVRGGSGIRVEDRLPQGVGAGIAGRGDSEIGRTRQCGYQADQTGEEMDTFHWMFSFSVCCVRWATMAPAPLLRGKSPVLTDSAGA